MLVDKLSEFRISVLLKAVLVVRCHFDSLRFVENSLADLRNVLRVEVLEEPIQISDVENYLNDPNC